MNEREEKIEFETIFIQPGTKDGTIYPFLKRGDHTFGHTPADIYYKLRFTPHEIFKVKGHDLIYETEVLQSQVIKGELFTVPTLNQGALSISLEGMEETNNLKRFTGHGLPIAGNATKRGDLIVQFEIIESSNFPFFGKSF